MSNIKLFTPKIDESAALEVLENLADAIRRGDVVAFACVGIARDDNTAMWSANIGGKTQLQFIGAASHLLHAIHHGQATAEE